MTKKGQIHILVIEDNLDDAHLLEFAFKKQKFNTNLHFVSNGNRAVDFLNHRGEFQNTPTPSLIILDLNLPQMDGIEILDEVKKNSRIETIPIIVFTSSEANKDILASYNFHANAFITKPTQLNELVFVVKVLCDFWFSVVNLPPSTDP